MKLLKWCPLVAFVVLTGIVFIASDRPDPAPADLVRATEAVASPKGEAPPDGALADDAPTDTAPTDGDGTLSDKAPFTIFDHVETWRETNWEDFKYPYILAGKTDAGTIHVVANHLLVTLRADGDPAEILAWAADGDTRELTDLGRGTYLLSWAGGTASKFQKHSAELTKCLGETAFVEADAVIHAAAEPNDPLYTSQEHLAAIMAPGGWSVRTDAPGIVVAVVDSGVRRDHPDLVGRLRARDGENPNSGQDETGNGFIDDKDPGTPKSAS